MTRHATAAVGLAWGLLGCTACGKAHGDPSAEAVATPAARSDASVVAAPSPAVAKAATGWQGSYKSAAGVLYIPPDWKDVHWKVKETDLGLGDGAIAMHVDAANGRASGTLDGPLGPAIFEGLVADGKLTAAISRTDPTDQGFTGTLIGTLANGRVEGTMNLSSAIVSAIRQATFAMSPEGGTTASY